MNRRTMSLSNLTNQKSDISHVAAWTFLLIPNDVRILELDNSKK